MLLDAVKRALSQLHERTEAVEASTAALKVGQVQAVDDLVAQITTNFSDLFTDASVVVSALQEGHYTSADIDGPVIFDVQNGLSLSLDVSGPIGFSPAPIVMIGRKANRDDLAVCRVVSWSKETNTLVVDVLAVAGDDGPHVDCYVEVGLLSALGEAAMLEQVQALLVETQGVRDVAAGHAGAASSSADVAAGHVVAAGEEREAAETARDAAEGSADAALGFRDEAAGHAEAAEDAAALAATFVPSNFYNKGEVDDALSARDDNISEVATAIADARADAATVIAEDVTAVAGDKLIVNSAGGAIVVTLPSAPAAGTPVRVFRDGASNVTIARNGSTIEGASEDLVLDEDKRGVRMTYLFGTWKAFPEVLA
ncbi:hypothetical protein [Shinella sp. DD12]|uniref:hypothetical protein n=1 Tax=Shinella sp. DD12 TaxID=1410620 RepID=UPI00040E2315|nr:hypothetical protein [Shinella sp. DD12]